MDHKPEVNIDDLKDMHPCAVAMIVYVCSFAKRNNLPCLLTSLMTDNVKGRISQSHSDGRAGDFSLKKWPNKKIHELVTKGNGEFYDLAAISFRTMLPIAFVYHDSGQGFHLHVQCLK